jgi:hypothetical protein
MYRIDAISDRIYFNSIEADNAVNKFKETSERLREKIFVDLFNDFKSKHTQLKINVLINREDAVEELKLMFTLVDKHLNSEREREEHGIAPHLLALLLNNIQDSRQLWKKMILMIDEKDTQALDAFLRRRSVMNSMSTVIENYLNSMCQVRDDFFIDTSNDNLDSKQIKLFNSLELHHMVLVMHHLLNCTGTSFFFNQKIFSSFELSPTFIAFLKLSFRNLSL